MTARSPDLKTVVWTILLTGLIASITLIAAGLVLGGFKPLPPITAANLLDFIVANAGTAETGPALLIYSGIALLLLTPFARVLASTLYFSLKEHDWKFTCITGFVLAVLVVVLFLV